MSEVCKLRDKATGERTHCDSEQCVYWRVVEHIDAQTARSGCAIQYFELLEGGAGIASWLLSVKQRLESGGIADNPLDSLVPHDMDAALPDPLGA